MKTIKLLGILIVFFGVISSAIAADTGRIATVVEIKGTAEVKLAQKWMPAQVGMTLRQGDAIRTKANSSALLNLDGSAQTAKVEVKQNSQLSLAELLEDKTKGTQKTLLDLALGEVLIKAQKLHSDKSSFEVKTPTSIVGVRGTTFAVSVETVE